MYSNDLERWVGERFSTCPLFANQEQGFLAIWECLPCSVLGGKFDYEKIRQAIEALMGEQALGDLMLLDAIIANTDRHLGNFEMLIHNDTNTLIGSALSLTMGVFLLTMLAGGIQGAG